VRPSYFLIGHSFSGRPFHQEEILRCYSRMILRWISLMIPCISRNSVFGDDIWVSSDSVFIDYFLVRSDLVFVDNSMHQQ